MPLSVPPLVSYYSFDAQKASATDRVNLAQLNAELAAMRATINALITALNVTTRSDDQLKDEIVTKTALHPEVLDEIGKLARAAVV